MLLIEYIKTLSVIGLILSIIALILVKIYGYEAKGATRWIKIAGFSFQPSEFMKPCFTVVSGWILSLREYLGTGIIKICILLYCIIATLLISQPDFGMLVLISITFIIQLFISGLPIIWVLFSCIISLLGIIFTYLLLPHVRVRIDNFLNPITNTNYQTTKSILAFQHGGLYGKGIGEGLVKQKLPDAHTDFIFAVAGEEFGAIICTAIIAVFAFIVLKNLVKINNINNQFIQLAGIGIISQFGLQAIINIGVSINLLPTKGMTLPFISYGGSSTISTGVALSILLGLTKKRTSSSFIKKNISS